MRYASALPMRRRALRGAMHRRSFSTTSLIKDSTRGFSDEEKQLITNAVEYIEKRFDEIGFEWPVDDEVVFISTTMDEECGTAAYTHGTDIYIGSNLTEYVFDGLIDIETFNNIMAHEFFHVLSRNVPSFVHKYTQSSALRYAHRRSFRMM